MGSLADSRWILVMHTVATLALEHSGGVDISIPCMIFTQVYPFEHHGPPAEPLYDVRVCGPTVTTTVPYGAVAYQLVPPYSWNDAANADTIRRGAPPTLPQNARHHAHDLPA